MSDNMTFQDKFRLVIADIKVYLLFRRIFDKLPEREKHLKALVEICEDFSKLFFDGDISTINA